MSEAQGESSTYRPIAFISHHNSQHDVAVHLKAVLQKHGIDGWIAPDDVEPGVAFDQAIIAQVAKSDLILLLFSEESDRSRHVKRELMLAEEEEKLIYPVRLEDIDAKGLAYWLKDYQWFDWLDQRDATIERLVSMIQRQVSDRREGAAQEAGLEAKGLSEPEPGLKPEPVVEPEKDKGAAPTPVSKPSSAPPPPDKPALSPAPEFYEKPATASPEPSSDPVARNREPEPESADQDQPNLASRIAILAGGAVVVIFLVWIMAQPDPYEFGLQYAPPITGESADRLLDS